MVVVTHEMGFARHVFACHFPASGKIEEEGHALFGAPKARACSSF